jgi:hypothetical protein
MVSIVTPEQPRVVLPPPPGDARFYAEPPLRRVLPAFGKRLLEQRRNGEHPEQITVVYGDNWRGVPAPKLALRPLQYQPGLVDWHVVAGVKVVLLDRAQGVSDFDVLSGCFGKFFTLIAELADAHAYVVVRYPDGNQWSEQDAAQLAYSCRNLDAWPSWWSDARAALQEASFDVYLSDADGRMRRKLERDQKK